MKLTIAFVFALLATTAAAYADTYNYLCKVDGKSYPLRVDDNKNVLEWRGKNYRLTVATFDEPDGCAKYGWHAEGNGTAFSFCTATQGFADIEKDGKIEAECNLKRQ
jgi:hypothetical protein